MYPPKCYTVFDLETTNLPTSDKRGNRDFSKVGVVEIGLIVVEGGKQKDRFSTLVKLEEGVEISEEAQRINGITPEMLEEKGVSFSTAVENVHEFLVCHDCFYWPVVGQNIIAFDRRIFWPFGHDCVIHDTKLIWSALMTGMKMSSEELLAYFYGRVEGSRYRGLSSLDDIAGILLPTMPNIDRHRATGDCILTHLVFEAMRSGSIFHKVFGKV